MAGEARVYPARRGVGQQPQPAESSSCPLAARPRHRAATPPRRWTRARTPRGAARTGPCPRSPPAGSGRVAPPRDRCAGSGDSRRPGSSGPGARRCWTAGSARASTDRAGPCRNRPRHVYHGRRAAPWQPTGCTHPCGQRFRYYVRAASASPGRALARRCGCSSMVERQLPKLIVRVRFSSPAPRVQPRRAGSSLARSEHARCYVRLKSEGFQVPSKAGRPGP